jgi:hypothetical protein
MSSTVCKLFFAKWSRIPRLILLAILPLCYLIPVTTCTACASASNLSMAELASLIAPTPIRCKPVPRVTRVIYFMRSFARRRSSLEKRILVTDERERLAFKTENKTLILICNSALVTLPYPLFNSIVAEVVRWNDVIGNLSIQPKPLQAN